MLRAKLASCAREAATADSAPPSRGGEPSIASTASTEPLRHSDSGGVGVGTSSREDDWGILLALAGGGRGAEASVREEPVRESMERRRLWLLTWRPATAGALWLMAGAAAARCLGGGPWWVGELVGQGWASTPMALKLRSLLPAAACVLNGGRAAAGGSSPVRPAAALILVAAEAAGCGLQSAAARPSPRGRCCCRGSPSSSLTAG